MSEDHGQTDYSQQHQLQRDLGRVEGKVDSLLQAMQNMLGSMMRADADRDNLQRDMADLDRRHTEAINSLKVKLYWLGGATAAGGIGIGAGASRIVTAIFMGH